MIGNPLISKFEKRLSGWKAKTLSRGSRLTLVNSVLTSLPLYWMSFYLSPKWGCDRIDKCKRNFLWYGDKECKGEWSNSVVWGDVCKPKNQGGMRVLDLKVMNQALLGKWLWKWFRKPDIVWVKITETAYFKSTRGWTVSNHADISLIWKIVMSNIDSFMCSTTVKVGTCDMVLF